MSSNKKRSSLCHNIINCAEKASQILNNKGKMCDNDKHTSLLLKIINYIKKFYKTRIKCLPMTNALAYFSNL